MKAFRPVAKPLALAVALAGAAPAFAVQFEFDNGLKASVDTTISYGIAVRADGIDPASIGIANGGTSRSVNDRGGGPCAWPDRGAPTSPSAATTIEPTLTPIFVMQRL